METLTKEQIIELLKEWQEWEYRVLMDDSVWENGLPTLTCEFMDEYNLLQQEREGILLASELTEKESEVRTAEEFIRSRIKNELTFNAFDTVQQYPICMIAEWAYEFSLQQPEKEQPSDDRKIATPKVIFERLKLMYNNGDTQCRAFVAEICDEILDKTGGLLGDIRDSQFPQEIKSK